MSDINSFLLTSEFFFAVQVSRALAKYQPGCFV